MIHEIEFKAMGCHMTASLDSPSRRAGERLDQTPGWFEEWEQALSRFREDSELSRLNRSPGIDIPVSDTLWSVFQASLEAEQESQGLVTPTILPALVQAGYTQNFADLNPASSPALVGTLANPVPVQEIVWDAAQKTIRLPAHIQLDFGGVAKGWAADQAAQRLKAYGPALVNAGGDIAVSGLREGGQTWPVAVVDPFQPDDDLELLRVGRCGVATSGIDYRRWKLDGAWKHHIIDPRSGEPANTDLLTVSVVAPSTRQAELAAKVVLILGSQAGLEWLEEKPLFEAILVLQNGERLDSQGMHKYIV
jgi:thiamine biosynthesis lipoprotein